MNYVQFHLGDWLAGTALLSPTERGVYMDLLVRYYKEERPIMQEECKRIARAYASHEQEAMQYVLQTFFVLTEEGYQHARCDEEIAKARDVSEKRKKSANARWSKKDAAKCTESSDQKESECSASVMQVHSKCNANGMLTINQEPLTNNQVVISDAQAKPARTSTPKLVKPEGVSDQVWDEYQAFKRKVSKGCCTQRMIDKVVREAEKAGISTEAAMVYQLEQGWTGFEAEWYLNRQQRTAPKSNAPLQFDDDYYGDGSF